LYFYRKIDQADVTAAEDSEEVEETFKRAFYAMKEGKAETDAESWCSELGKYASQQKPKKRTKFTGSYKV